MLAASVSKKIRHHRDLCEDEITSIVFGEMRHLSPRDIWLIFSELLSDDIKSKIEWPSSAPEKVDFHFWPRSGSVEPDLLVKFYSNGSVVMNLLIEVKWDANLSACCQLIRQWAFRKNKTEPWIHLYLVKKGKSSGLSEIENTFSIYKHRCNNNDLTCCDQGSARRSELREFDDRLEYWQDRLHCISWLDVVNVRCPLSKSGLDWLNGVCSFFERLGIVGFYGFSWIDKYREIYLEHKFSFYEEDPYFEYLPEYTSVCGVNVCNFYH